MNSERCSSYDCYEPLILPDILAGKLCAQRAVFAPDRKRLFFGPGDILRAVGQDAPIDVPIYSIQDG